MATKTVKLPAASKEAFAISPEMVKIVPLVWRVDPPWLQRLSPELIREITRLRAQCEADVAQLEAQIQARYAELAKKAAAVAKKG